MCLSAMESSRREFSVLLRDQLRAAIEPNTNPNVQSVRIRVTAGERRHALGLGARRREAECGGTPRALANSGRARVGEGVEHRADIRAHEARSALRRRIVVAQSRLQLGDRGSKARKVLL